jgi:hypothetical protein
MHTNKFMKIQAKSIVFDLARAVRVPIVGIEPECFWNLESVLRTILRLVTRLLSVPRVYKQSEAALGAQII